MQHFSIAVKEDKSLTQLKKAMTNLHFQEGDSFQMGRDWRKVVSLAEYVSEAGENWFSAEGKSVPITL